MRKNSDCFVSKDGGETWETFNPSGKKSVHRKPTAIVRDANGQYVVQWHRTPSFLPSDKPES
jgi:hypothetical protein